MISSVLSMGSLEVKGARERWLRFVVERFLRRARSDAISMAWM
jgi:hypothetical protein